jgi:D-alanyl-lipoteichoic acid acyltransferase DltB (MBOAT superfamily)
MTFFPHLVAGPIVRASDFIPQINSPHIIDRAQYKIAFFRIILGLSKKLLIADFLSKYVDMIHTDPSLYSGLENIMSMYAYSCQIYFDFSGYSDIAIGIALLLGYELKENFENPYKANNITDFWRRWHISLSSWLRDYIYIPLGGSRKGKFNTYLFLLITMTIGGIWHGASWNFIIWGIAHGMALIVHKLIFVQQNENNKKAHNWSIRLLGTFITFNFVSFLWILFRAQDFQKAYDSVIKIISGFKLNDIVGFYFSRKEFVFMLIFSFVVIFMHNKVKSFLQQLFIKFPAVIIIIMVVLFLQFVLQVRNTEIAPFIYFQF